MGIYVTKEEIAKNLALPVTTIEKAIKKKIIPVDEKTGLIKQSDDKNNSLTKDEILAELKWNKITLIMNPIMLLGIALASVILLRASIFFSTGTLLFPDF